MSLMFAHILTVCAVAAPGEEPMRLVLGDRVIAEVDPAEGLVLQWDGDLQPTTLLTLHPVQALGAAQRRQRSRPDVFLRAFDDPAPYGHRGFSSQADDDSDGLLNEDRADGVDNDGDGVIDEDFAMLGDRMVVMSADDARGTHYLQCFGWQNPHLNRTLFVIWNRSDRSGVPEELDLVFDSPGTAWRIYSDVERPQASPTYASRFEIDGRPVWLGLRLLEGDDDEIPQTRLQAGRLETSQFEQTICALIVSETLDGLCFRSECAFLARAGGRPRPGEDPIPWLVPPLQPIADATEPPNISARQTRGGDLELTLELHRGWFGAPDPERLLIDGYSPGVLKSLSWSPHEAAQARHVDRRGTVSGDDGGLELAWPAYPGSRSASLGSAEGVLSFVYATEKSWTHADRLQLLTLSGQSMDLLIDTFQPEENINDTADSTNVLSAIENASPRLSPNLLEVSPNPFTEFTSLHYRVPKTIAEGFVWGEDNPPLLDPEKAIPYSRGEPTVTLNIYSVSGHRVATLFDGSCGIGDYQATWTGFSDSGRRLAAGTYFCKLQVDNWSTTQAIMLLK